MDQIESTTLWTGTADDAREPRELYGANIRAVIDIAFEEKPAQLPRDFIHFRIPIVDGEGNSENDLRLAVKVVATLLNSKTPTLVACSAGLSRSPTVAAFALALTGAGTADSFLSRISRQKPIQVNGLLWLNFEHALK